MQRPWGRQVRSVLWGSRGPVELKQSEGGEHASEMRSGAGGGGGGSEIQSHMWL